MTPAMPDATPAPRALPGARSALALLLAINLFNYIDRYILAAVEPMIRRDFFRPDDPNAPFKMGLLATAFLVSYMCLAPVFGWLGDRWRRWAIIGIGVILWSVASGASGVAWVFGILLVTRVFVGVGEAAYGPVAPTIIADMYPVARRGAVLAWFYMAIPVGSALGYVLGGFVASHLTWHWAFFVVVPPGILLGILCFLRREPPRGGADAIQTRRPATLADYKVLLRTPSYVLNTLGMTAMTFAVGGVSFWMPTYVYEFRTLPPGAPPDNAMLSDINLKFGAITVVAGLAATLLGGLAGDRLRGRFPGAYFLVSGAGMLIAFPMFLLTLYMPFPLAWVFIFLSVFFLFFNTGPTNTILANVTHPAMRSAAFALTIFIIHAFGDAISPPIIGLVTGWTTSPSHPKGNMNAGFLLVSFAILVGGVCWLWGARYLERDTALAPRRLDAAP